MRIATYNIEWFTGLFDEDDGLLLNTQWSSRRDVTKHMQAQAIAKVLHTIDADAVMVIEAPNSSRSRNTLRALERFAAHFGLRTSKATMGFTNSTSQEIALLYDPAKVSADHTPFEHPNAPQFDGQFDLDLDVDDNDDPVVWSKPPFEVTINFDGLPPLIGIGVHAKSKAPHGATSKQDAMWISIANRRKQLAQCIWLRKRVDGLLADNRDVIVMGDFNDGPGLDKYEKLFGRSGVEIVLGEGDDTMMYDPHAAMALGNKFASPTTSRFWLNHEKRYLQALLDYIMVSPNLRHRDLAWKIWHPFEDPTCYNDPEMSQALLNASDHFPVTLDIGL